MTGFDPSAFLVKRIASSSHTLVTTVNVKSNDKDGRKVGQTTEQPQVIYLLQDNTVFSLSLVKNIDGGLQHQFVIYWKYRRH